ncbi:MAG TPA: hypothetical protein VHZ09_03075 [Acidobacteriaceae bacterium]|jgi:hypothetical protein|nr:hypothetical protein [Acidobacteriaceae bacterium]
MAEAVRPRSSGWFVLLLLAPMFGAALPSLLFCALEMVLWLHGAPGKTPVVFHLPPVNGWDRLFAMESSIYRWIARWNSAATLAATLVFVTTLMRPRWRSWAIPALIPYSVLLCADLTLRWRYALMP